MRQYTVRPGDSPATIAAEHAGCPRCAKDLVRANPHKPTVVHPNGYETFVELVENETLNLPDKWFSAEFEALPPVYFAALPAADGVTPSRLGDLAGGVLGDFATLENAAAQLGSLASMGDADFAANVDAVAATLDQAVSDAISSQEAGITRAATALARRLHVDLVSALAAGDSASGFKVRTDILRALSEGLSAARRALEAKQPPIPVSTTTPATVTQVAAIDPCSAVNVTAVCAAQAALGITVDGKYGDGTAAAVRARIPGAPVGCSPRPSWWAPTNVSNCPGAGSIVPVKPPQPADLQLPIAKKSGGISMGMIAGMAALGAGTVGLAIYLTKKPKVSAVPQRTKPKSRRKFKSEAWYVDREKDGEVVGVIGPFDTKDAAHSAVRKKKNWASYGDPYQGMDAHYSWS